MSRLVAALVVALSLVGAPTTCATAAPGVPVNLSLKARIDGGWLHIDGKATVPDGAWVTYAAYRPEQPRKRVTGYTKVKHHRFAAKVGLSGWPAGKIVVDADFQVNLRGRRQPINVIAMYGPEGQHMTGSDVVKGGGHSKAAVASVSVEKQ